MATPTLGLPISSLVNVNVYMSPQSAATRSFGSLLVVGDSDVIDTEERLRKYLTVEEVGQDFGAEAPEYKAAVLFYSQRPRPAELYIGRWANVPTHAVLHGGLLDETEQDINAWRAISNGRMAIAINGVIKTLSGLNFSTVQNLNAVASMITAALGGVANVRWDAQTSRFDVTTTSTGPSATLGYALSTSDGSQVPAQDGSILLAENGSQLLAENGDTIVLFSAVQAGSGTDISDLLQLSANYAYPPVTGRNPETPLECVMAMADLSADWYGLMFATEKDVSDNQHMAIAEFIEACDPARVYGISTRNKAVLQATVNDDIASRLKALSYQHTFVDYSAVVRYSAAAVFGRAFSVNFTASNSTITLMFKEQVGIPAEKLSVQEARTLEAKHCNVFALYNNGKAILQHGRMAGGWYFDERHGLDWLQNAVQTEIFNLLYTSETKIPQTEQGIGKITSVIAKCCAQGVINGLIAPGVWNADDLGQLKRGETLTDGYYIYHQLLSTQSQSEREQRKAPVHQIAVKLAGAVHSVDVLMAVNR